MKNITLLEQLTAIPSEDFCSIHHEGRRISGRCIDLFFHPEIVPLAFIEVKKIKSNLNDFEIFLITSSRS